MSLSNTKDTQAPPGRWRWPLVLYITKHQRCGYPPLPRDLLLVIELFERQMFVLWQI